MERDPGGTRTGGVDLRKKLREILAVEELLESEGWLENPETEKLIGRNMDKTTSVNPDIATFWYHCGLNRDKGITSLLRNEPVSFKDFQVDDKEIDVGTPDDLKSMKKDLPEIISDISDALPIKRYV